MRTLTLLAGVNDHLLEQGTVQRRKDKPLKNPRAKSQMVSLGLELGWPAGRSQARQLLRSLFPRAGYENHNSSLKQAIGEARDLLKGLTRLQLKAVAGPH